MTKTNFSNVTLLLLLLYLSTTTLATSVIAVLGSSVARGHGCSGNCSDTPASTSNGGRGGCYQALLKNYQQQNSRLIQRKLLNSARNGDDTSRALVRLPGLLEWIAAVAAVAGTSSNKTFVLVDFLSPINNTTE